MSEQQKNTEQSLKFPWPTVEEYQNLLKESNDASVEQIRGLLKQDHINLELFQLRPEEQSAVFDVLATMLTSGKLILERLPIHESLVPVHYHMEPMSEKYYGNCAPYYDIVEDPARKPPSAQSFMTLSAEEIISAFQQSGTNSAPRRRGVVGTDIKQEEIPHAQLKFIRIGLNLNAIVSEIKKMFAQPATTSYQLRQRNQDLNNLKAKASSTFVHEVHHAAVFMEAAQSSSKQQHILEQLQGYDPDSYASYHSSFIEKRAKFWESQFQKRYYPDYRPELAATSPKVDIFSRLRSNISGLKFNKF